MVQNINIDFDQTLPLMRRTEWGAHIPRDRHNMRTPVGNLRFTSTGTGTCKDEEGCIQLVRAIQETYLDTGFDDIPHNFLVAGDGNVYEGRGWTFRPDIPGEHEPLRDDCIDIAYVGDFGLEEPPWEMLSKGIDLIKLGLYYKNISPAFKIIPYTLKPDI